MWKTIIICFWKVVFSCFETLRGLRTKRHRRVWNVHRAFQGYTIYNCKKGLKSELYFKRLQAVVVSLLIDAELSVNAMELVLPQSDQQWGSYRCFKKCIRNYVSPCTSWLTGCLSSFVFEAPNCWQQQLSFFLDLFNHLLLLLFLFPRTEPFSRCKKTKKMLLKCEKS